MKIICISGKAGSGKDFTANIMREELEALGYKVLIAHNADLVKYVCTTFFNWNGKKDEEGRGLLQYVGTDIVRTHEPSYWVNFLIDVVKFFGDKWDYVLIPDCRFPNEIINWKKQGYDTFHLRVKRPDFDNGYSDEKNNHVSETALDNFGCDCWLENSGDESYRNSVKWLVSQLID